MGMVRQIPEFIAALADRQSVLSPDNPDNFVVPPSLTVFRARVMISTARNSSLPSTATVLQLVWRLILRIRKRRKMSLFARWFISVFGLAPVIAACLLVPALFGAEDSFSGGRYGSSTLSGNAK